jgi:transposase InsO family protein
MWTGVRLHGLRHRRLCPPHRRLAGQPIRDAGFVLDALEQALHDRHPVGDGLVPSVGSVGDSYDNALAETINGLTKLR